MNPKKCPKCGESNPPEAVMCWACYTPLSGAAGGATASTPARAAAQAGDKEKTALPPWALPVLGVVLLAAVGVGVKLMFFNAPVEDTTSLIPVSGFKPKQPTIPDGGNGGIVVPSPPPTSQSPGPSTPPPPQVGTYAVVAAPNPRYGWGTMAIVPAPPITDTHQAAALAVYARRNMMRNKNWRILHIYVFADQESGLAFRSFQSGRNGRPLGQADYPALANLWPHTLVRYEFNQGVESVVYPSTAPDNWWNTRVIGKKVTD